MRPFLNNFINTLSTRRQERVSAILDDARVGKEQLQLLTDRLTSQFTDVAPLVLADELEGSIISAGKMTRNFRDAFIRVDELFAVSNLISLLLDSHAAVLSSDIKAIEDELIAMEKMADNFAFLLSDSRAYNFAFLEPFSDESGRETSFGFQIPDRAGQAFNKAEQAAIRSDEGTLVLPDDIRAHAITGTILKGNATGFSEVESALENALQRTSTNGWRMVVNAAGPVVAPLPEANGEAGAQVLVEFSLSQPAPACEIKMVPFSDFPIEVLSAKVYANDDDSQGVELLESSRLLDRPVTLYFPMQTVTRFRLLLNQPIFVRRTQQQNITEKEYERILKDLVARRKTNDVITAPGKHDYGRHVERLRFRRLQQIVRIMRDINRRGRPEERAYAIAIPHTGGDLNWGPMRLDHVLAELERGRAVADWMSEEPSTRGFYTNFQKTADTYADLMRRQVSYPGQIDPNRQFNDQMEVVPAYQGEGSIAQTGYDYKYQIGLQYVGIGVNAPGFKGVFVSKAMTSPGDIGEVRIKTAEQNYFVPLSGRDSNQVTSVEYSVTNVSNPDTEDNWIPILPMGVTTVEAERFFVDTDGKGYFRMSASPIGLVRVYRNGESLNVTPEMYLYGVGNQKVLGVRLPTGEFSSSDIFTCDYTPVDDNSYVNFETRGFTNAPLVAAYDSDGAGEGFIGTTGRNEVDLLHTPYVDPQKVASSNYSATYGLNPYQPITIRFEDGTIPVNLTNYKGGDQTTLDADATGYYYLHSGNTVIFNKAPAQPFRVFYQYLQNNVRFRVVLRVNDKNFVSPKVDFVHLKAKTRRSNPSAAL